MPEVRLFPLEGATRQDTAVQQWFTSPASKTRALARLWLNQWHACGEDVEELLHDGYPTVCVRGVALGYVNAFTEHVNVGFFLGATLPDPAGLLEGNGRFMRHVKIYPAKQNKDEQLRALIRAAHQDLKTRLAESKHAPTSSNTSVA